MAQTVTEQSRALFRDKFHVYHSLRRLLSGIHVSLVSGTLLYDNWTLGADFSGLKRLDAIVFALTVLGRTSWHHLFKNPEKFLGLRRPTNAYRWAVLIVSLVTMIPNLAFHFPVILASARTHRPINITVVQSTIQLVLFVAICGLHCYLIQRFLLTGNDEHYEPLSARYSAQRSLRERPAWSSAASVMSLHSYRDEVEDENLEPEEGQSSSDHPHDEQLSFGGLLSVAYARQFEQQSEGCNNNGRRDLGNNALIGQLDAASPAQGSMTFDTPQAIASERVETHDAGRQKCPTLARFDFMRHNQMGTHSIVTDPIIPWLFGMYSIAVASMVTLFALENRKGRFPLAKANYTFLAPIGCLLLCAYAERHRLRRRLFLRSNISLPSPWVQLKSQSGNAQPVFINTEMRTETCVDPRLRAFHNVIRQTQVESPRVRSNYMKAYNANPTTCSEYWGHNGRSWSTDIRLRPFLHRLLFLGLSLVLFAMGSFCAFSYPVVQLEDRYQNLPDVTLDDQHRLDRIMRLDLYICAALWPLAILVLLFVFVAAASILVLLGRHITEHKAAATGQETQATESTDTAVDTLTR